MIVRHRLLMAALFLAAGVAGNAGAATEDGSFAIRGIGGDTCSAFQQRLQSDERVPAVALSWLLGYSTAINRTTVGTFDVSPLTDPSAILRLVVAVCQQAPDVLVDTVAHDVLNSLARARVTTASPIVETRSGENVANVRRETLVQMQQVLINRGHLGGTADGVFGPQTATALKSFQEQHGLQSTGVADSATIFRLLVELPAQAPAPQ
jgi:hypothetical protein